MKPFLALLALAATTTAAFSQGPLAPSAAPAPTMKTLAQIEARTPIPATVTAAPGPHFTITQPGSYYLTGNVTVTSGNGILITAASDVSLDLNGFTVRSTLTGSSNGVAILLNSNFARLTVCHGFLVSGSSIPSSGAPTLQGFSNGIYCAGALTEAFISGVHIRGMAGYGMFLDKYGSVENCTASNNGDIGISALQGRITKSTANNNRSIGISATLGTVTHCTATSNGSIGISAERGTVTNSIANNNGNIGIGASQGSVTNSHARENFKIGIFVGAGVAAHCTADSNSTDTTTVDKEISVAASGQRDACVPATE